MEICIVCLEKMTSWNTTRVDILPGLPCHTECLMCKQSVLHMMLSRLFMTNDEGRNCAKRLQPGSASCFHLGSVYCRKHKPHLIQEGMKIAGASAIDLPASLVRPCSDIFLHYGVAGKISSSLSHLNRIWFRASYPAPRR